VSASSDLLGALLPVVEAMKALGVVRRIGGPVASSALGVPRSTLGVLERAIDEPSGLGGAGAEAYQGEPGGLDLSACGSGVPARPGPCEQGRDERSFA